MPSTELGLTANDLGLKAFKLPPTGFDPKTATQDVLRQLGVPSRPGADSSSEYRQLWNRMFAKTATYVAPRFTPRTPSQRAMSATPAQAPSGVRSTSWAGMGIESAGSPIVAVSCTWTVPNLSVPSAVSDNSPCINSVWIGIDGFSPPNSDILQAGVDLKVTRQAGALAVEILPWWEWWKGQSFYFNNFPVSPGDSISCTITCAKGDATGAVYMANLVNGQHIQLLVPAPAGTTLIGNCAEWIVERQTADASSDVLTELSAFGSIFIADAFTSTVMGSPTPEQIKPAGKGIPITMMSTDGTTMLASSTILGQSAFRVDRL